MAGNCGACHNGDGQIAAQLPSFAYPDVLDGESVVRQMIGQPSRWQAKGRAEGTLLIDPASPESSAVLLRMSSRRPSSQMPPLGTVIQDQEAIEKVRQWIGSR
jgi:mono/diheme cytochrome c family protein